MTYIQTRKHVVEFSLNFVDWNNMQFPYSFDKVQLSQAGTTYRNFSDFSLKMTISVISYPLDSDIYWDLVTLIMDTCHEGMLRFESYLWSKYSMTSKNDRLLSKGSCLTFGKMEALVKIVLFDNLYAVNDCSYKIWI